MKDTSMEAIVGQTDVRPGGILIIGVPQTLGEVDVQRISEQIQAAARLRGVIVVDKAVYPFAIAINVIDGAPA